MFEPATALTISAAISDCRNADTVPPPMRMPSLRAKIDFILGTLAGSMSTDVMCQASSAPRGRSLLHSQKPTASSAKQRDGRARSSVWSSMSPPWVRSRTDCAGRHRRAARRIRRCRAPRRSWWGGPLGNRARHRTPRRYQGDTGRGRPMRTTSSAFSVPRAPCIARTGRRGRGCPSRGCRVRPVPAAARYADGAQCLRIGRAVFAVAP